MLRRTTVLGALVACALLAANMEARASYSFTTGTVTGSPNPFTGTATTAFTPRTGAVSNDAPSQQAFVTITFSGLTGTPVSGVQTISWTETLNSSFGQVGVFSISGTLTINGATNVSVPAAIFSPVTITPIGPGAGGFTLVSTGYTQVVGTTNMADLGFNITAPQAVPEPASLAILGTGLLGVLGLSRRRKRRA